MSASKPHQATHSPSSYPFGGLPHPGAAAPDTLTMEARFKNSSAAQLSPFLVVAGALAGVLKLGPQPVPSVGSAAADDVLDFFVNTNLALTTVLLSWLVASTPDDVWVRVPFSSPSSSSSLGPQGKGKKPEGMQRVELDVVHKMVVMNAVACVAGACLPPGALGTVLLWMTLAAWWVLAVVLVERARMRTGLCVLGFLWYAKMVDTTIRWYTGSEVLDGTEGLEPGMS
ncbi:hypothetical protein F5Y15DRAFT_420995 [Xylariaceae sp. FL0016]|nr:hypothetical protein F5Y15DRAFT_420995 [Xylariaceae sp. FL0016]